MSNTISHRIGYVFDPQHNQPLDVRYRVPSLTKQVDISQRVLGYVFFTEDTKELYIYDKDITKPSKLSDFINRRQINGIEYTADYKDLLKHLNEIGTKIIGSLVTIFPLKVTFVYNGKTWVYHSGEYNVATEALFNSIDKSLVGESKVVIIGGKTRKITLATGLLSDEIMVLDDKPLINNRFYTDRGNLYYCISGTLFNVGAKETLIRGYQVNEGKNKIEHNLKAVNLEFIALHGDAMHLIDDEYTVIDENIIEFESYCTLPYKVDILIKTK